jgi:hypothetical protein
MAKSTICTILKNRETIKKADVARGVTVFTKQRLQTIEEVDLMVSIDFVLRICAQSTVVKV